MLGVVDSVVFSAKLALGEIIIMFRAAFGLLCSFATLGSSDVGNRPLTYQEGTCCPNGIGTTACDELGRTATVLQYVLVALPRSRRGTTVHSAPTVYWHGLPLRRH